MTGAQVPKFKYDGQHSCTVLDFGRQSALRDNTDSKSTSNEFKLNVYDSCVCNACKCGPHAAATTLELLSITELTDCCTHLTCQPNTHIKSNSPGKIEGVGPRCTSASSDWEGRENACDCGRKQGNAPSHQCAPLSQRASTSTCLIRTEAYTFLYELPQFEGLACRGNTPPKR